MLIKDRIVELKRIKGSQLRPNPKNWRTHSKEQQDAIKGILAEVGFAGACLVRQLEDGSYMLIDGHARTEVSGEAELPCLVLDVTEQEADKILATYDPLGAMAGKDAEKLDELLKSFEMDNEAAQAMLDELNSNNEILQLNAEGNASGQDQIPEQYQILIQCSNEREQAKLLEELNAKGINCRSLIS